MEEVGSFLGRFLQQHASTQQRAMQVEVAWTADKITLREIGMAFCSLPPIPLGQEANAIMQLKDASTKSKIFPN